MPERRDVTREHMLAMQQLWTEDVAAFDGRYVSFSPSWSWPKPSSRAGAAGPPVLIGGAAGPKLFAHIAEYADGWIPIGGAGLSKSIPQLRNVVEEAGRDPSTLQIVPFGSIPDQGKLDHFTEIGVTECVFRIPSAPRDKVLPVLDKWVAVLAERSGR